jgi:hypothetical protein
MNVGAWGDPHIYIRKPQSLNPSNPTIGKFLAKLDDNKSGASGSNEIRLLDIQTSDNNTYKVFYRNKAWSNGAKVVDRVRVEVNGSSTIYTTTARRKLGPIDIFILETTTNGTKYLQFEMGWSQINNVVKIRGALAVILKRVSASGGYWDGGAGLSWDGIGRAASSYGLARSSFETGGLGMLSDEDILDTNELSTVSSSMETLSESSYYDGLTNRGEDGEGDNAPVNSWDDTFSDANSVFVSGGIQTVVDTIVGPTETPTPPPTSTPTPTPEPTPTSTLPPTPTPPPTYTIPTSTPSL